MAAEAVSRGGNNVILFKTAFLNLRKYALMNILTVLEITAAVLVAAVMVSSILIRYEYYSPFKDFFRSEGFYCEFTNMANGNYNSDGDLLESFIHDEEILSHLGGAEKIAACNDVMVFYEAEGESLPLNERSYNDEIIKRFVPKIKEGRWLNTGDRAEFLEAVVSENDYGWKVGDRIPISFYNWPESITFEAVVVGELSPMAKVPGKANHGRSNDFNMFYTTYDFKTEEKPLILFSSEYLSRLDSPVQIVQGLRWGSLIAYPENTDRETLKNDLKVLNSLGCGFSMRLGEIDANSRKYLYGQIYNLLPIIIVILILALVSSISSTALSTARRLRDYSVYYITGLRWGQCILINLIQSVLISAAALFLSCTFMYVVKFTPLAGKITIIWNVWTLLTVAALIFTYLLSSMLMPAIIIGRNSPKQILAR